MNGTDRPSDSEAAPDGRADRSDIVRSVTSAGWFAFVAWLMFLFRQVARVSNVGEQRFAGLWEQRIEVLSFIVLPPNVLMLAPAAIAATVATWLAGSAQTIDLAIQLRLTRWAALLQAAIASVSAVTIVVTETGSPTESQDLAMRFGGLAFCIGLVVVTRGAERSSPGWSTDRSARV